MQHGYRPCQVAGAVFIGKYGYIIMPHRTQGRNKIMPTNRQKRPTVRLCGGGLNRPDCGNKRLPRLTAFWAFVGIENICNIFCHMNLQFSRLHAYVCRKLNFGGKSMNTMFLYFAYGSNMNPARMAKRCPGAIDLGGAVLRNHRVVERLYADIVMCGNKWFCFSVKNR